MASTSCLLCIMAATPTPTLSKLPFHPAQLKFASSKRVALLGPNETAGFRPCATGIRKGIRREYFNLLGISAGCSKNRRQI